MSSRPDRPHAALIAFDGEHLSPVLYGEAFAAIAGVPVHVATAYRYEAISLSSRQVDEGNEERYATAEQATRRALENLVHGTAATFTIVPSDGIAAGLAALAVELDASVIVVGPDAPDHHVVHDLLRHVHCPVLVAPDDASGVERPRTVAVAFDGSPGSRLALEAAERLAVRTDATLEIITVLKDAAHSDDLRALVQDEAARIDHVAVRTTMPHGDPADALHGLCERVDLVVCGSHGRGTLGEIVLGSVSSRLVADPVCPVLVVPSHARRDREVPLGISTAATR